MNAKPPAMTRPVPRASVLAIEAYQPGKSAAPPGVKLYKLSSNETPVGPSPLAIAAFKRTAEKLETYPDGSSARLRQAIAAKYGLDADRIICGNGSDDLLALISSAYLGPGDEAIYSAYGFVVYPIAIKAAGATPVTTPEKNFTADVDAMLAAVTARTKIVFLANPNNPTGSYLPFDEVKRLQASLPPHVLLVLDAAYAEYVRRNDDASGLELVATSDNVIMTRTFSKIYGLAALRVGWAYAPAHVIGAMNRIRGAFNVNAAAIEAGIAALSDDAHMATALAHNDRWLPWLTEKIEALGLKVTPSVGNFILIHFPETPGRTAKDADAFLTARGLVLRRLEPYHLPNALRLTIGTQEANEKVVAALQSFIAGGARA